VIKLTTKTQDFDFSFPRREVKIGEGHKGFKTEADPFMEPMEAAKRRDFTINALMLDILSLVLFDFFGGVNDLEAKILKHTSPAFAEDPLRVLRAMQFSARFGFSIDESTAALCNELGKEFHTISKERLWIEFEKFFTKGKFFSHGIETLEACGWDKFFEGIAPSNLNILLDSEITPEQRLLVGLSQIAPIDKLQKFLVQINAPIMIQKKVLELATISAKRVVDSTSLRMLIGLNKKFCSLEEIACLFKSSLVEEVILSLSEEELSPRITGDDLMEFGWSPKEHKKAFGEELKRLFEIQLERNLSKEVLVRLINKI
jgi:tRNA nucleotidyltransferase/poly(A) polymerase